MSMPMLQSMKSSRPTVHVAVLLPAAVTILAIALIELAWSDPECRKGALPIKPFSALSFVIGAAGIAVGWYAWHRRQPTLVIGAQSTLAAALTAFLLFFAILATGASHECFS